jgi:hypothetical protein
MKILETVNRNTKINYSDILGNKSNGFAYDITLKMKYDSHDLLYDIKVKSKLKKDSKCELLLIGAHDLTSNTGGYGINATGMKVLLNYFKSEIIIPLRSKGVDLEPLQ